MSSSSQAEHCWFGDGRVETLLGHNSLKILHKDQGHLFLVSGSLLILERCLILMEFRRTGFTDWYGPEYLLRQFGLHVQFHSCRSWIITCMVKVTEKRSLLLRRFCPIWVMTCFRKTSKSSLTSDTPYYCFYGLFLLMIMSETQCQCLKSWLTV